MGITVADYPTTWSPGGVYDPGAAVKRNQQMLDEGEPDALFAFPGGKGTADMVRRARKASLHEIWVSERNFFKKEDEDTWFLSNFAEGFGFEADGVHWDTSEHFYQALKSNDPEEQEWVRQSRSPAEAKKRGQQIAHKVGNWQNVKNAAMTRALNAKFFYGTEAARLLMETGFDYLIEYAPWGDTYWGVDVHHQGQNWLGQLLMKRRHQLVTGCE